MIVGRIVKGEIVAPLTLVRVDGAKDTVEAVLDNGFADYTELQFADGSIEKREVATIRLKRDEHERRCRRRRSADDL